MLLILRTVAGAPYNYNFLDTTKEPSAYLPRAYPYVYWLTFKKQQIISSTIGCTQKPMIKK